MTYALVEVVSFLRRYQRQHRIPPTQREIAQGTRRSLQTVSNVIRYLGGQGIIVHKPKYPRGAYLPDEPYGGVA